MRERGKEKKNRMKRWKGRRQGKKEIGREGRKRKEEVR